MDSNSKLYDLTTLKEMLDDDTETLNVMLAKLVQISPKLLEDIKTSFDNNDLEKVGKLAHEIKPSIDILNIKELQVDIRLIEKNSQEKDKLEELRKLITKLNDIYTEVLNEIAKIIS